MSKRDYFLPVNRADMEKRNWDQCDFIMVTGDAYVDHPSFGTAILSRILEKNGYKVGIIAQPDWKDKESVSLLGRPKYAFLVTSGNMDSMVNHYTSNKRKRRNDAYTPGGKFGKRPDRAVIVYTNLIKSCFRDVPVIIGGIEASLRRMAHYDYWENKIRRSILFDSKADILVYGMGEKPIVEIAEYISAGVQISQIRHVRGTAYVQNDAAALANTVEIPSYDEAVKDATALASAYKIQAKGDNPFNDLVLAQRHGNRFLVQNPPQFPLKQAYLDDVYDLPYVRESHPDYESAGGIPAFNEMRFSITAQRGCFGDCSFCAISRHQGKHIQQRSHESIIKEAKWMASQDDFKGYIQDVGGPTANFRAEACSKAKEHGYCDNRSCLAPSPCPNLVPDHNDYVELLRKLRELRGIKKVFIKSGVRYDYMMLDPKNVFFKQLCKNHISGQLKVAPEHVSNKVLGYLNKPSFDGYKSFRREYFQYNRSIKKEQYLVPYFISSHPGSRLEDAIMLAEYLRDIGRHPEQVQDFYPTPGTLSTVMYCTGLDPRTMEKVYVPKGREKELQRALLQYWNPKYSSMVYEALKKANRMDLVGYGEKALIRPQNKKKEIGGKNDRKRKIGSNKSARKKTKK
ncbi:MAG TPA: YgiQ family radical SAM protein [Clostridia bacterium]|nr:YgiQ family radical SAM protein [Clostridia bacterium]